MNTDSKLRTMIKTLTFVIVLAFISFHSFGYEKVPGVVVYPNETISVTFDVQIVMFTKEWDFTRLQKGAYFYDATGKKRRVSPKQALEIQLFLSDTDTIRMVSIAHKASRTFARLVKEGKLNTYSIMTPPRNSITHGSGGTPFGTPGMQFNGGGVYRGYLLVKKGDWGPDVKAKRLRSRKEMIEFFSDCSKVVEEIEDQNLTNKELSVVVDFYYQYCGDN